MKFEPNTEVFSGIRVSRCDSGSSWFIAIVMVHRNRHGSTTFKWAYLSGTMAMVCHGYLFLPTKGDDSQKAIDSSQRPIQFGGINMGRRDHQPQIDMCGLAVGASLPRNRR